MKKRAIIVFIIVSLICCGYSYTAIAMDEQENTLSNTLQNNVLSNTLQNNVLGNFQTDDINELQNIHNELEGQVEVSNEQLQGVQVVLSETMQQIQDLNEKIEQYQVEIDSLGKETSGLVASITQIEQKLKIAEKNYNEKKEILKKRLVILYETGETSYLDVLLNSKSITDFISRYYLITQIAEYDEKLLEEAEIEKVRIETAKNTLDRQRKQYKTAKENAEKTAIVLENTKVVKNSYINKLSDEEKKLQEKIDLYNQLIKDLENEIMQLVAARQNSEYIGGNFIWPVPGYTRITSPYGMRVHPITGVYKLHTGTDVGAPEGTEILAMNSGIVVKASYNGAYGNMVMIDHGGGVLTLYAHGSEILVVVGQTVNKGDPILKVGMTGYTTGPHAHFEIRINGEYTDPMQFVRPN